MRTPLVVLAAIVLAGAPAAAQTQQAAASIDFTNVRKELRNVLVAQETYYSNNGRYSPDLGALNLAVNDSITIKFVESKPNAWSASATIKGKTNASCVIMVGAVTAYPATVQGRAAKAEGAVLCDGDPS